jgi:two-component system chemotaxis response regulator CheY
MQESAPLLTTLRFPFPGSLQATDTIVPSRWSVSGSVGRLGDRKMKRCMFVDDSSVIRKVAKRILGGPMIVIEAASGYDALEMCMHDMPDIIVVDAALPDLSAEEFIRRVRAIQGPVKPQIAICLTEVDIGAIMRAKRAGAQGYLLKPFNRPQLLQRFRSLELVA